MPNSQNPSTWQPKLPFDDELWGRIPEESRERCRTLFSQLLRSVLERGEGRQHERED
jgi:hypothetical protein